MIFIGSMWVHFQKFPKVVREDEDITRADNMFQQIESNSLRVFKFTMFAVSTFNQNRKNHECLH